ncbi:MAG: hypothetical protein ACO3A2_01700 [Bdellovibrionia bacterium]
MMILLGLSLWSQNLKSSSFDLDRKNNGVFISAPSLLSLSSDVVVNPSVHRVESNCTSCLQQELIENLEQVVFKERQYRSEHGSYSQSLSQIGFQLPRALASRYILYVNESSSDQLLVTAISESHGALLEVVSIDQDFRLYANFQIPEPRLSALKAHAYRHLKRLEEAQAHSGETPKEWGVFVGYFDYVEKKDAQNQTQFVAHGIKYPVDHLELDRSSELLFFSSLSSDFSSLDISRDASSLTSPGAGVVSSQQKGWEHSSSLSRSIHDQASSSPVVGLNATKKAASSGRTLQSIPFSEQAPSSFEPLDFEVVTEIPSN